MFEFKVATWAKIPRETTVPSGTTFCYANDVKPKQQRIADGSGLNPCTLDVFGAPGSSQSALRGEELL